MWRRAALSELWEIVTFIKGTTAGDGYTTLVRDGHNGRTFDHLRIATITSTNADMADLVYDFTTTIMKASPLGSTDGLSRTQPPEHTVQVSGRRPTGQFVLG